MCIKEAFVLSAAAVVLLTGAPVALARDWTDDRDNGINEHQTELDQQYARTHQAIPPGARTRNSTNYTYVRPHRPTTKHRLASAGTPRQ
jgi:hypothetical protein